MEDLKLPANPKVIPLEAPHCLDPTPSKHLEGGSISVLNTTNSFGIHVH